MVPDSQIYAWCMEDVKQSLRSIYDAIQVDDGRILFSFASCQFSALQLRYIYENVAFASLAAHKKDYLRVRGFFEKDWDINRITKIIKGINADFLPVAATISREVEHPIWGDVCLHGTPKFTRAELVKRHGYLGNILHARNPYTERLDYRAWAETILMWAREIDALLATHVVKIDQNAWYLVLMNTAPEGHVKVCEVKLSESAPPYLSPLRT